jgi:hypothetical protein
MKPRFTVLISGMVAGDPGQGGAAWAVLQYVLGLARLGHDVFLVEPVQLKSIRPQGVPLAESGNARYFLRVLRDFGLADRASLLLASTRQTVGLPYEELERISRRADLLLNISGMLTDENLVASIPIRTYLDIDPAFNQLWHAVQGIDMRFAAHNRFVTIGQAIGTAGCPVPTCGLDWLKIRQPVVLPLWPVARRVTHDALTTIANWRGYGSIEHQGVLYGQKAHSLRQFFPLPTRTREKFLLALSIHPDERKDLEALSANRWQLISPAAVADTPGAYQAFVQGSKAEFGIAKSGYARSRCGWFSDRSVCYLASGRPVIAQETGFSRYLPVGEGLFSFTSEEDVLAAITELNGDYARHTIKAREIAEEWFASGKVLGSLLGGLGMT